MRNRNYWRRGMIGVLGGFLVGAVAGPLWAQSSCDTDDVDDDLSIDLPGDVDPIVYYNLGDCDDANEWEYEAAKDLLDAAASSLERYRELGFVDPWQSDLPEYKIVVEDDCLALDSSATPTANNAYAGNDCQTYCESMTNNGADGCNTDELFIRMVMQHEMFHHVEHGYACDFDTCGTDLSSALGKWIIEGCARYLQDKLFDDLDASNYSFAGFANENANAMGQLTTNSLLSLSYRASLFWNYCGEQFGAVTTEPEYGYDFVKLLFENIVDQSEEGDISTLDALDETIDDLGGPSLNQAWLDFAIATYVRNFDLDLVADPDLYRFIDEDQHGEGGWGAITPVAVTIPAVGSNFGIVAPYSMQVFEAKVGSHTCEAVGFRGESEQTVGWAVIARSGGQVVGLSKGIGKEFGRSVISGDKAITDLAAVVVSLDEADVSSLTMPIASLDFWMDHGTPELEIELPTFPHPAFVSVNDEYRPFSVTLVASGPANLEPEGAGERSMLGLRAEDFTVTVGGQNAPVVSAQYLGQFYTLMAVAPATLPLGAHDVTVSLCQSVSATNADALVVTDLTINHMLVIDHSGSMESPEGNSKLDAAKIAATLYTDATSPSFRVGMVAFNGDGNACDDDTGPVVALGTATNFWKSFVKDNIDSLDADGETSIGDGLWKAQDNLDVFDTDQDAHVAILLSDGEENEARYWNVFAGCDSAASRYANEDTVVNTIVFGPECDQNLMQEIAGFTGGYASPMVDVTAAGARGAALSMANHLSDVYMEHLQSAENLQRMYFSSGALDEVVTLDIPIDEGGITSGVFFFNVGRLDSELKVELTDPQGHSPAGAEVFKNDSHAVYIFDTDVDEGTWKAVLRSSEPTDFIAGVLGRAKTDTELELSFSGVPNGGGDKRVVCDFELGVPVNIQAVLTSEIGPVIGATVEATIIRPDGSLGCSSYPLVDDGTQNDGDAGDGVYGLIYTETALGTTGGVDNDSAPPPPASPGTYSVYVVATGSVLAGETFQRYRSGGFVVCDSKEDVDADDLPDTWEIHYGTDMLVGDESVDDDADELINRDEFWAGSDPFDPDTDGDGETDGSEVAHGRCPVKADELVVRAPVDVEVITERGDTQELLPANGLLLRFPWRDNYAEVEIHRSTDSTPDSLSDFVLYAHVTPTVDTPKPVNFIDTDVSPDKPSFYRFRAVGLDGAKSRFSHIVGGVVPFVDCNGNGIHDMTDVEDATSGDANGNNIPDECEDLGCDGDSNGDGAVDPLDSGFVLARFGCPVNTGDVLCDAADANGDGVVDPLDVGYVLSRFGTCP